MENDDQSRLPEAVYTFGFLKSYASFLGLNVESLVKLYKQQFRVRDKGQVLDFPVPAPERHIPSKWLVLIATFIALFIFIVWTSIQTRTPVSSPSDVSITPEAALEQGRADQLENSIPDLKNSEVDHPTITENDSSAVPNHPEDVVLEGKKLYLGKGKELTLTANSPSWIEIKTRDGKVLMNKTLKAGESEKIETQDNLIFSTGNAGSLTFQINDHTYEHLGKPGEIISKLELHFTGKPTLPTS